MRLEKQPFSEGIDAISRNFKLKIILLNHFTRTQSMNGAFPHTCYFFLRQCGMPTAVYIVTSHQPAFYFLRTLKTWIWNVMPISTFPPSLDWLISAHHIKWKSKSEHVSHCRDKFISTHKICHKVMRLWGYFDVPSQALVMAAASIKVNYLRWGPSCNMTSLQIPSAHFRSGISKNLPLPAILLISTFFKQRWSKFSII